MATEKTKRWAPAIAHVLCYGTPFIVLLTLTSVPWAKQLLPLLVIVSTHLVIDHFRLARYLVWVKNFIAPKWIDGKIRNQPWSECEGTGYHKDRPAWLAVWLLILADNITHLVINALAIKYLT